MNQRFPKGIVTVLILLFTVGLGALFIIEYLRTPDSETISKLVYLIMASALLPSGVLWAIEHFFLVKPLENEYKDILGRLETKIEDIEIYNAVKSCGLRSIGSRREVLAKSVLENTVKDGSVKEIIIVGSTLDGLIRRTEWFEQFIRNALKEKKELKLMFTHWDYVTHRERQEDRPNGAISQELRHSLSTILGWGVNRDSIKLVYGAPTAFMVIAGNNMIVNPYPFGREAVTSMAIWLINPNPDIPEGPPESIWRQYYINHYHKPWNSDKPEYQPKDNKDTTKMSYPLPEDWETQIDKFIEGIVGGEKTFRRKD